MKNVIHEIHRRSLWQVLGIYIAVSWVVLQVVDVVGSNFGLPAWVAPGALVILLLGLPIVIATAFLQEGMTPRVPEQPPQSLSDVGEVERPSAPEPSRRHKLFTWKNALLGGGSAFAVLGLLTAGYLFMRTAGIGPAGTLVAQGSLEAGAEVLLAEFESSDPDLAGVVTGALRIDLAQSPIIRLVPRSRLAAALRRMQRDEDAQITSAVARELAVREGYGATIEGEIGSAGSGYVLTANIVSGDAGEPLAGFRVTANSEDDLIHAIETLSRDIRDKAGESLRSVRNAPGLSQVSTTSLEALRLYTRGESVENSDELGAIDLFAQAVEIDPDFAMAYRKIGVSLTNMGLRRDDAIDALSRAFALKDRLPPAERYLAEAFYFSEVMGDRAATIRSYERLLESDPGNRAGLNNLAVRYIDEGRLEEAEALLERALAEESFYVGFRNLAFVRVEMGHLEAADEALDLAVERLPGAAFRIEYIRLRIAVSAGEYELAATLSAGYTERFRSPVGLAIRAFTDAMRAGAQGQLEAAESFLEEAGGARWSQAHPMRLARHRAALAMVRGDSAGAVRGLLDAYETHRDSLSAGDRAYGSWLPMLAEAGAASEAAALNEEWKREVPDSHLGIEGRDGRRELDARLAFAAGDLDEAERLWEEHGRECGGGCRLLAYIGLARIHEARGEVDQAIEEYERYANAGPVFVGDIPHFQYRAEVLERLGQLHDERGDREDAAKYYAAFVELWKDADEELQPRVRAAQARLDAIGQAGGS